MKLRPVLLSSLAFAGALASATPARALEPSKYGPWYVHGTFPLGLNVYAGSGGAHVAWRPDVDFGYHFFGTQDGPALGLRQAFLVTAVPARAGAQTSVRFGWGFAFPVSDFEIHVEPEVNLGIAYLFDGPSAGIAMGLGLDGKFFFLKDTGLYAFYRPFEMGFACAHDAGTCVFAFNTGAGVGFAF